MVESAPLQFRFAFTRESQTANKPRLYRTEIAMPLSHELRCIFVHIPKCAGTSIEFVLGMHGPLEQIGITPYENQEFDPSHLYGGGAQHMSILEIREKMDAGQFEKYWKFCIVRNPWDRFISHVAWKNKKWMRAEDPSRQELLSELTGLIKARLLNRLIEPHLKEQWQFVCDRDGQLLVDFVGRYEKLDQAWKTICEKTGVSGELEKRMGSTHEKYTSYYNILTRFVIYLIYKKDIKMFGYRFSGPSRG